MRASTDAHLLPRTAAASAPMQMMEMLYGALATQMISVAAKLNIADLLADGPRSADDLAAASHADPAALFRLLRALAGTGVFTEVTPGTFGTNALGETLRTGAPGSMKWLAQDVGGRTRLLAYSELAHSVKTGKPAFDQAHGTSMWTYLQAHPAELAVFGMAMGNLASEAHSAVFGSYDLCGARCLVDVGGGEGYLIAEVLPRYPGLTAILFDEQHVTARAAPVLAEAGVADRTEIVSGDLFKAVPDGADVYVLSSILFSYLDSEVHTILENIRKAMDPAGKILILEPIIPAGDAYHPGKLLDVCQLALHRGGVRGKDEWEYLFSAAGLRLAEVREMWPAAPTDLIVAVR